jgi:selenium metabolism protein YedF
MTGKEQLVSKEIDCRGLACPAPVLEAKNAIEKEPLERIEVLVDNEAAKENVSRFLGSRQYEAAVTREGDDFRVIGTRAEGSACEVFVAEAPRVEKKKIMVLVPSDRMGRGDDDLGSKLVINFLKTLKEMGGELWRLVFLNGGVRLTIAGSQALPDLKALEDEGLTILVCGTCLNHFDILDKKQVGVTTNMLDIVTAMQLADKVISI